MIITEERNHIDALGIQLSTSSFRFDLERSRTNEFQITTVHGGDNEKMYLRSVFGYCHVTTYSCVDGKLKFYHAGKIYPAFTTISIKESRLAKPICFNYIPAGITNSSSPCNDNVSDTFEENSNGDENGNTKS